MKQLIYVFLFAASTFLLSNCGDNLVIFDPTEENQNDCWRRTDGGIMFTQLTETKVELPSKISIYFKLEDKKGKPIGNLTEANFTIFEQTETNSCLQPVSEFEALRSITSQKKEFTHTTLILLDLSGSVLNALSTELKEATKSLVNEINPNVQDGLNKVGIWWFDGSSSIHQLIAPSFNRVTILESIERINANLSNDNSTNLYGGVTAIIETATAILTKETNISGVSILLFTDGKDRANRVSKQAAYDAVDKSNPAISFFTVGLGAEISEADLQKFGKDGFVGIKDVTQLKETFKGIAQSVEEESNSYYLLEYCSPVRGGTENILIVEAVANEQKGYMEAKFNAAKFEGGCKL